MRLLSPRCRTLGALALMTASLLPEAQARAEARPALVVHRTDDTLDCPDAPALAALVARQMRRPALDPLPAPSAPARDAGQAGQRPTLTLQIYRSSEGYTAGLETDHKTRTLSDSGSNCAGLTDALAVTLTILLDTEMPPSSEPAAPSPPPIATASPFTPSPFAPAPSSATPSLPPTTSTFTPDADLAPATLPPAPPVFARRWGLSAGLNLMASTGVLQPLSLAIAGDLDLRIGRSFSVAAGFALFPSRSIARPFSAEAPNTRVDISLTVGLLRACAVLLSTKQTRGGPCVGLFAGTITGEGVGYPLTVSVPPRPWFAATGDAFIEQHLWGAFALVSRGSLLVPLRRETFAIERYTGAATPTREDIFTPSPIGAALDVGLSLSIW